MATAAQDMSGAASLPLDRDLFVSPPPRLSFEQVAALLERAYGIHPHDITALASERDANFRIDTDGGRFTLKVSNAAEPPAAVDLNSCVLNHINERAPDFPAPKIVRTVGGGFNTIVTDGTGKPSNVRLLTYLDGLPLGDAEISSPLVRSIGSALGRLSCILDDFDHPHKNMPILWDSTNVHRLAPLLDNVPDKGRRDVLKRHLRHFETHVRPTLGKRRRHIIHNDANPGNVLVNVGGTASFAGIFDFGDIVYAPAINELAVAATYLLARCDDVVSLISDLVSGYAGHAACTPEDLCIVPDLMTARFLTTILITHWRADLFPGNADYILRNNPGAWAGLERMDRMDRAGLTPQGIQQLTGQS